MLTLLLIRPTTAFGRADYYAVMIHCAAKNHLPTTARALLKDADWWIYMIRTHDNQLYTGITNNVQKRWLAHVEGKGAKYFRAHRPLAIVYLEPSLARGPATLREHELKQLTKHLKEQWVVAHASQTADWLNRLGVNTDNRFNAVLRGADVI